MTKQVNTNIPAFFQQMSEVVDDRFMKVKIWLMHLGENYNGSYFDKASVEKAIPTLANTPILGFIEDKDNGADYSDHRMVLVRESDGDIKVRYLGQAYGLIPQDNNAKFELRVGDDGVTREYLTVEGLLWRKWDFPTEIMDRDLVKAQSMELDEKFTGYWDKDYLFHFEDFKFFGACILGSGVMPAMNSASIEKEFAQSGFQEEMQGKMEEFKVAFARYQQSLVDDTNIDSDKDGENMQKLQELMAKYSLTEEMLTEKQFDASTISEDELEAKLVEVFELGDTSATCEKCGQGTCVCEPSGDNGNGDGSEPTEFEILKSDYDKTKTDLEKLQGEFDVMKTDYEKVQGDFATLSTEAEELRTFKTQKTADERVAQENAIYDEFADQLTVEEIDSVKEKASDLTLDEVKFSLFALVGMKSFKPVKPETTPDGIVKVGFKREEPVDDGYNGILTKHIKN